MQGIFNDEAFAKIKKGARIVNVARGGVIDDDALARAIDAKQVAQVSVLLWLRLSEGCTGDELHGHDLGAAELHGSGVWCPSAVRCVLHGVACSLQPAVFACKHIDQSGFTLLLKLKVSTHQVPAAQSHHRTMCRQRWTCLPRSPRRQTTRWCAGQRSSARPTWELQPQRPKKGWPSKSHMPSSRPSRCWLIITHAFACLCCLRARVL